MPSKTRYTAASCKVVPSWKFHLRLACNRSKRSFKVCITLIFRKIYFFFSIFQLKTIFIRISEVRAEDEGQYVCIADNIVGQVEAIAYVEIISFPSVSIRPPGPITVEVGQRLRLECSASGKPPPAVQWRINTAHASPE